jgi:hypothetical protein
VKVDEGNQRVVELEDGDLGDTFAIAVVVGQLEDLEVRGPVPGEEGQA